MAAVELDRNVFRFLDEIICILYSMKLSQDQPKAYSMNFEMAGLIYMVFPWKIYVVAAYGRGVLGSV